MSLKIKVKKPFGSQTGSFPVVRISAENYDEIATIATATNRSIKEVVSLLLDYSLERVEIEGD